MSEMPLVMVNRQTLLAVEPLTGVERWRLPIEELATRLFVVDRMLLVALAAGATAASNTGAVLAIELASGKVIGRVELPFRPSGGAVHEGHLFLVGEDGAACLGAGGQPCWVAGPIRSDVIGGATSMEGVVARDPSGRELWRYEGKRKFQESRPGLAIGTVVAQPDLR